MVILLSNANTLVTIQRCILTFNLQLVCLLELVNRNIVLESTAKGPWLRSV